MSILKHLIPILELASYASNYEKFLIIFPSSVDFNSIDIINNTFFDDYKSIYKTLSIE